MDKVLVTGASGLIGKSLLKALVTEGWRVRGSSRSTEPLAMSVEQIKVTDQTQATEWSRALKGIDVVVHLASRVHVMNEDRVQAIHQHRETNYLGTLHLAQQAARVGVRRFVFMSTAKVSGESSLPGRPLKEHDPPSPAGPYAESKHSAEMALRSLSDATTMDITIIRPPLVYGPGVRGNFHTLMRLVYSRLPLPLRSVNNLRSFVYVDNLADFVVATLQSDNARGATFFVSDGADLSTPELLTRVGKALGVPAHLLPAPPVCLRALARITRQQEAASRLLDSLQLDIGQARRVLGWDPPHGVEYGLLQTAEAFHLKARRSVSSK